MHFPGQPSARDQRTASEVLAELPMNQQFGRRVSPRSGETWWTYRARVARAEVAHANWLASTRSSKEYLPPPSWEVEANLAKWDSPAWADPEAIKKLRAGTPPFESLLPALPGGQPAPLDPATVIEAPSYFEPTAAMLLHERMLQWQGALAEIPVAGETTIEQLVSQVSAVRPHLAPPPAGPVVVGGSVLPLAPLVLVAAAALVRIGGRAVLRRGVVWIQKNERKIKLADQLLNGLERTRDLMSMLPESKHTSLPRTEYDVFSGNINLVWPDGSITVAPQGMQPIP